VKVREDRGDGCPVALDAGRLFAPGLRVQVGEQELIHSIVDGVGLEQDIANFYWCRR
jgi:hypothetical protein